jgi:hypothetical protein
VEQIEEFIAWKGSFELAYFLENIVDAPYKYEVSDNSHFALIITRKKMAIFLNILIDALQQKRLMP